LVKISQVIFDLGNNVKLDGIKFSNKLNIIVVQMTPTITTHHLLASKVSVSVKDKEHFYFLAFLMFAYFNQ